MMFCLDDGAELLYGPASVDEPATAIFSGDSQTSGSATQGGTQKSGFAFTTPVVIAIVVVGIVVIAGVVFGVYQFKSKKEGPSSAKKITRLTTTGTTGAATISPDGKYVITGSEDGTARLWHTDYHDTIRFVCSLLGRDLTQEERRQYKITDNKSTCPNR